MSPVQLMILPFLECLVLVGIHSYLGLHVIKRKVIFVDLALAQIAALGTIVGLFAGLEPHTFGAYLFSLMFTFIGAAVFSLTRLREERIPQEAVIGLVYALAAAVTVLVIDRAPHGAEHIKEILTGTILWVDGKTILLSLGVYAAVGGFHFAFRRRFFLISEDPAKAFREGVPVRLFDFLFYMSFGLVITLSVHTAGVLLVFVFLVVPAVMAILITDRLVYQLLIGWGAGLLVSVVGLAASYAYDFPSGPMVVAVYGAALLAVALGRYVVRSASRVRALVHIAAGAAGFLLVAGMLYALGRALPKGDRCLHHDAAHAGGGHDEPDGEAHGALSGNADGALLVQALLSADLVGKQKLLSGKSDPGELADAYQKAADDELRLALAERLLELDRSRGLRALVDILTRSKIPLFRSEALSLLRERAGEDFGYDPMEPPSESGNRDALERWRAWLESSGAPR
jgi:zinc/manganese transport system permease protein